MSRFHHLLAGLAAVALSLSLATHAVAGPILPVAGVCPTTTGNTAGSGGGGPGNATDCTLLIVFGPGGTITTYQGAQTDYESIDDALIGIVNNSGATISSFVLAANPGTYAFDGDGIDGYVNGTAGIPINSADLASGGFDFGYGGPLIYFSDVNFVGSTGTVNVGFGGLASLPSIANTNCSPFSPGTNLSVTGAACNMTYFSLEEPATLSAPAISVVPEPTTLTLLGSALALGALRRRRRT